MAKTESISDERLAEMLAGLEGLPPSPYWTGDNEAELIDGKGRWLNTSHGEPIWEHFARCDPDTIRSILTELATLRAANSDGGVEPAAYFYRNNAGAEVLSRSALPAMAFAAIPYKQHPLFLHPPAKALDGIAVTDEMVERAARSIAENHWSVDSDFIKAVHVSRTWEYHADDARAALAAALK